MSRKWHLQWEESWSRLRPTMNLTKLLDELEKQVLNALEEVTK